MSWGFGIGTDFPPLCEIDSSSRSILRSHLSGGSSFPLATRHAHDSALGVGVGVKFEMMPDTPWGNTAARTANMLATTRTIRPIRR